MLDNKELGVDKTLLLFVLAGAQLSDSDSYFQPRPEPPSNATMELESDSSLEKQSLFIMPGTSGLIFHLDHLTGIRRLYIPLSVASELLAIAHGERHPGFSRYYEIISRS